MHKANIYGMRTDASVSPNFLKSLQCLSADDVRKDPAWEFPTIVCASNYERHCFNFLQAKRWAKKHGEPLLVWYSPIREKSTSRISTLSRAHYERVPSRGKAYSEYVPRLKGYFVRGAICYIVDAGLQPNKTNIVNGTEGKLHSLTWDGGYKFNHAKSQPGEVVEVPIPYSVNVMVKDKVDGKTRVRVIPNKQTELKVDIPARLLGGGATKGRTYGYLGHKVEISFAVTFHKVQGKTVKKILVNLDRRVGGLYSISFEGLYVVTSRVERGSDFRVWPTNREDIDLLRKLKPLPQLNLWNINYRNGKWLPDGLFKIAATRKKKALTGIQRILTEGSKISKAQLQYFAKELDCYRSKDNKTIIKQKLRVVLAREKMSLPKRAILKSSTSSAASSRRSKRKIPQKKNQSKKQKLQKPSVDRANQSNKRKQPPVDCVDEAKKVQKEKSSSSSVPVSAATEEFLELQSQMEQWEEEEAFEDDHADEFELLNSVDKAKNAQKEKTSGKSVVQPSRPDSSAGIGSSQQASSAPLIVPYGEGVSFLNKKVRQQTFTECAAHAVENACKSLHLQLPLLDFSISNEDSSWIEWQLEFVATANILVVESYLLFTKMDNIPLVLEPAMRLLAARPISHSVAMIVNTARHQVADNIFNHWVCFCIRHHSGVVQPVEIYDSLAIHDHGCEQIANLLYAYASKNFAGFASAAPADNDADYEAELNSMTSVMMDPTLPSSSVPLPFSSESIGVGGIHDLSDEDP